MTPDARPQCLCGCRGTVSGLADALHGGMGSPCAAQEVGSTDTGGTVIGHIPTNAVQAASRALRTLIPATVFDGGLGAAATQLAWQTKPRASNKAQGLWSEVA